MKIKGHLYCILYGTFLLIVSCRQPYNPPSTANATTNYLVVDGFINTGSDSTIITLSRTRSLAAAPYKIFETTAQVFVESAGGYSAQLINLGNGEYGINGLNLDNSQQYRLRIVTGNGSKYLSDFTPVKISPPIDSISWRRSDTAGVTIYANTHDPLNNTRYYRWDYTETWEYHSLYPTYLRWNAADSSVTTAATQTPSVCWNSDNSTNISLATSASLGQDVIYGAPLTAIALNSAKISDKYSIIVRQYALTQDAYNYWENLKKSTEQAGTLFDQEPSQITGNIHSVTNPNEPVIGYISTGTVAQQRIFITNNQVIPWDYSPGCSDLPVTLDSVLIRVVNDAWLPIKVIATSPGSDSVSGYFMSSDYCVDCTMRLGIKSGTDNQPSFWQ